MIHNFVQFRHYSPHPYQPTALPAGEYQKYSLVSAAIKIKSPVHWPFSPAIRVQISAAVCTNSGQHVGEYAQTSKDRVLSRHGQ